jgi:hypothetical protein
MQHFEDSDLRDPSPPVPGDKERAAVAARANQLGRKRRFMQGAGALGMVAAVAVGVAALTAGGASGPGAGTNRIEAASSPATTDTTDAVVTTTVPAPVTTVPAPPAPAPAEGNAAVSEAPVPEPTVDTTPAPVEPTAFSVSGTVGNIPEGAILTVTLRGGAGNFSGTADAAGYFSIGGVPTGEYQASYVWVAVDGTASQIMKLGTHLIDHNIDNLNFNLQ